MLIAASSVFWCGIALIVFGGLSMIASKINILNVQPLSDENADVVSHCLALVMSWGIISVGGLVTLVGAVLWLIANHQ